MMTDIERDDWAERLGTPLRDRYDAIRNEPIPERLRELVEQLDDSAHRAGPCLLASRVPK
jgi:hypothetical protein